MRISETFSCDPTPQARYPGQLFTAGGGCSACNPETKELGAFAAELLAVVTVEKSRGKALGGRYPLTGKIAEVGCSERFSSLEKTAFPVYTPMSQTVRSLTCDRHRSLAPTSCA